MTGADKIEQAVAGLLAELGLDGPIASTRHDESDDTDAAEAWRLVTCGEPAMEGERD